ncbi:MAG: hypothetical protein ACRCS0_09095 [Albidovulum sp.]
MKIGVQMTDTAPKKIAPTNTMIGLKAPRCAVTRKTGVTTIIVESDGRNTCAAQRAITAIAPILTGNSGSSSRVGRGATYMAGPQ